MGESILFFPLSIATYGLIFPVCHQVTFGGYTRTVGDRRNPHATRILSVAPVRLISSTLPSKVRTRSLAACISTIHSIGKGKIKVKVKLTLEQATKAQRGSRGIALLFL